LRTPAGGTKVRAWSAWAPGREERLAWESWARSPEPLGTEGVPDVRFLPAMLRRRCTPLTRIMLRAAFDCCPEEQRAEVRTVFASRHGSINESIDLIGAVVTERPISPMKFSHTVHNAQAGLFSIAAVNRQASSSMAAQEDSFPYGFLEALTHLERDPGRPVLLVVGDVPLAPTFAALIEEPAAAYAVALLLAADDPGEGVVFTAEAHRHRPVVPPWPQATEFLRWWLSGEPSLALQGVRQRFRFERQ
jgi:hypothetical protein